MHLADLKNWLSSALGLNHPLQQQQPNLYPQSHMQVSQPVVSQPVTVQSQNFNPMSYHADTNGFGVFNPQSHAIGYNLYQQQAFQPGVNPTNGQPIPGLRRNLLQGNSFDFGNINQRLY